MIRQHTAIGGFLLLLVGTTAAEADPQECRDAIDKYNTAIEEISSSLRRYTNCVRDSHAHDECSSEFRRLKSAQGDFEDAVSNYGTDCQ